jgi:hypothetical protein
MPETGYGIHNTFRDKEPQRNQEKTNTVLELLNNLWGLKGTE